MCRAVRFRFDEKDWEVAFANRDARLPVLLKTQEAVLMTWGRRPREKGSLPIGGWAKREHIHGERWAKYMPKAVKIPASAFREQDVVGNNHWFEVTRGKYLQGLIATGDQGERRLYVVTIEPPPDEVEFEQWPRVVTAPNANTAVATN